ncbi:SLBB domain-containing protein [Litorilituus sediminis]|uniref:Polysaccharide biosynthesis/export protein n=1 Tax=Litorilituus sediminis TaxID=718192 RepID=A0A4V0ZFV9_9GAMM|nr:SLBB domain-containing protein [Litorilituus sediminis]QBG35160.1 polysaccharide biosynthesis/export protein [Litorilituus sediminis]
MLEVNYNKKLALLLSIICTLLLLFSYVPSSYAAQVSQQQLEQFKKLPASQQAALAKSMGVDINALKRQISSSPQSGMIENSNVYPRGTQFDAQGNPIFSEESQQEKEDDFDLVKELEPFGYDVFANAPQTFAPTMDIAIPANYIVGPGDKISIQVFGKENEELELDVNREGQIIFPQYGPYTVAGMTYAEMEHLLTAKIKEKVIGVDVVIGMASLRSMRVFVLGDAYKPGPYTLSSLSSITHAIFAAGGISEIGSLRNVQLKRAGKLVKTLDLYDLLIKGDSSDDMLLQSGDVVFIAPVGSRVRVEGEVRRPAIYELAQGETFKDVIAMSGGVLPTAFAQSTIVERFNRQGLRSVVNIDLSNAGDLARPVQAGDAVRVMKSSEMFSQSVTLIGAVNRPGKYQWHDKLTIAELLPSIDTHLLANADLNYGLVIREIDLAKNIEVLQFDLVKALSDKSSKDNIKLASNDKVVVFSSIAKVDENSIDLELLAYTQEELTKKEQQLAKENFKTKQFWQKYGDEQQIAEFTQEEQAAADTAKLFKQSIEQMSGGELEEEIDIKELALFSRQRLLLPIIEKLKRQGRAGAPLQLAEIDGAVKFPGVYPLAVNARVSELIIAGGGLTESAYLARSEITRNKIANQGAYKESFSIDLGKALAGDDANNVLLTSKDRVNIHKIPAWSENHVVELRGEFVFPGKYTIRRGESLADLIEKAGGFTPFAHQEGSVFTRVQLRDLERQNLLKLTSDLRVEMASKSLSDKDYTQSYTEVQKMLADMAKVEPVGRLVVDLPKVITDKDYDVLLEDGDVLYVPTMKNSVNVIGQVQVTSSHIYDETLTAEDYLAKSGGSKKRADTSRIYIISANGSIREMPGSNWFSSNNTSMQPGDTVVVPLDAEYMNNLTLWTSATTIMYNTAVAIAAISGIN